MKFFNEFVRLACDVNAYYISQSAHRQIETADVAKNEFAEFYEKITNYFCLYDYLFNNLGPVRIGFETFIVLNGEESAVNLL